MKILERTQFGNPILRTPADRIAPKDITSVAIQELIQNMRHTLEQKKYGVGLAAPQVGVSLALSVIGLKPTPTRRDLEEFEMVLINPEIVQTYGRRTEYWEGCISFGGARNFPYALVPRYKKIRLKYYDEKGKVHEKDFEGFQAHVIQHEVDHLNGVLYVDRVKDNKSFIMSSEFKRFAPKKY